MPFRGLLLALWAGLFLHAFSADAHAQAGEIAHPPALPLAPLLDSAAVHAELATMLLPVPEARHARLFTVRFDSAGQPDTVAPTFAQLMPVGYARAVSSVVRRHLRSITPSSSSRTYDLLVRAGPRPAVERVQLEQEPPRALNSGTVQRAAMRGLPWDDARLSGSMMVMVQLSVDEAGLPVDIEVSSSSGVDVVDQAALAAAARFQFHPARVDGVPVRVRIQVPLNYSFGVGRPFAPEGQPARPPRAP